MSWVLIRYLYHVIAPCRSRMVCSTSRYWQWRPQSQEFPPHPQGTVEGHEQPGGGKGEKVRKIFFYSVQRHWFLFKGQKYFPRAYLRAGIIRPVKHSLYIYCSSRAYVRDAHGSKFQNMGRVGLPQKCHGYAHGLRPIGSLWVQMGIWFSYEKVGF